MGTAGGATMATKIGTSASETITGTSVADTLYGRGGNDALNAPAGAAQLYGETGNDPPHGGTVFFRLAGAPEIDPASYSDAPGAVTASLATHTSSGNLGTDTLVSI